MPLKLDLTEKLIEAENVEAMQNVLDLSIGLIGEEKSLYDLALSFLCLGTRVSDPYSFFTDPDPDPEDPDGCQYGSGSNPDPGL
jgi:hypothetical protein